MSGPAAAGRPARRRKLVFVNRFYAPDLSASSQMLTGIAESLARTGAEVQVVCSRQSYEDPRAGLSPLERCNDVEIRRVATTRFGRAGLIGRAVDYLTFYVAATVRLLSIVRRGDVVIAKTDPPLLSIIGALVCRVTGAHLVNWLQDIFPEVAMRLGASPLPKWAERALISVRDWSLRAAAANIVLGERMLAHVSAHGVDRARIHVSENWADGDHVTARPTAASRLRAELGLAERFVVQYSGNLGRAHEIGTLLAAAEILAADPLFVFLMVGGGANMRALEIQVRQRKLDCFRFVPYQPSAQVADSLAAGDVHLVSLLPEVEGLVVPSKLYGILAAGRPVVFIGDPDGEVARVLRARDCGITVACADGEGLARAVRTLHEDCPQRRELGRRARSAFEERYTLEASTRRWRNLLAGIGAPQPAPGAASI